MRQFSRVVVWPFTLGNLKSTWEAKHPFEFYTKETSLCLSKTSGWYHNEPFYPNYWSLLVTPEQYIVYFWKVMWFCLEFVVLDLKLDLSANYKFYPSFSDLISRYLVSMVSLRHMHVNGGSAGPHPLRLKVLICCTQLLVCD